MKIGFDTTLVELGLSAEVIQILEQNNVDDWMSLTVKNAREFSEVGLSPDQISEIFTTVKNNMQ